MQNMTHPVLHRPVGYYCFLTVAALGIFVSGGFAADAETIKNPEVITGFLDQISEHFQDRAGTWEEHFQIAAKKVFRTLLIIDFAYVSFDVLFLKGEDIRTWAGEILRQVLIIGFFSWILFNSSEVVPVVMDGFGKLAGIAADQDPKHLASPSKIIKEGLINGGSVTLSMLGGGAAEGKNVIERTAMTVAVVLSSNLYAIFSSVIGAAIILIYCMIACRVLITQIEVYISLACGVVVLAFGGSRWTREPAIRYCWFLMALALKLFTIYMLVSLGHFIIQDVFLKAKSDNLLSSINMWFTMMGCLAIWLVILWVIPNSVAQLVSHIGGVGGGGAAGASAAAGLIGGSLAFAGSAASTAVKAAGMAAAPATAGGGLAVSAAVTAGEKAMQMGIGAVSAVASQAGGAGQGQGGNKNSLGGIASRVSLGSTNSAISSGRSQTSSKAGSSPSGGSGGAAAGTMAANAALGGIAKGVTGTMSGAASLGATGTLSGQRTSSSPEISSSQQREAIKRSSNFPKK